MYPTQVDQAMVRSNALLTILISSAALASGRAWIMVLLALDFAIRGFFNPRRSILSSVSSMLVSVLPFRHVSIYFPPKQFAARVGMVFSLSAALLAYLEAEVAAAVVTGMLVLFAALECFLNICMGCIVYSLLLDLRRRLFSS